MLKLLIRFKIIMYNPLDVYLACRQWLIGNHDGETDDSMMDNYGDSEHRRVAPFSAALSKAEPGAEVNVFQEEIALTVTSGTIEWPETPGNNLPANWLGAKIFPGAEAEFKLDEDGNPFITTVEDVNERVLTVDPKPDDSATFNRVNVKLPEIKSITGSELGKREIVGGELPILDTADLTEREMPRPYMEEVFIPGPQSQIGIGPKGTVVATPQYGVRFHVYVTEKAGIEALGRYANAFLRRFPPRWSFPVYTDRATPVIRVRSDTGPFAGQALSTGPGWIGMLIMAPLRIYTQNVI